MNGNSPIKSLFDSPDIAALSRTSIFNNNPGNSSVLCIKNASKKSATKEGDRTSPKRLNPLIHLIDLGKDIKERKGLRGKIKKILMTEGSQSPKKSGPHYQIHLIAEIPMNYVPRSKKNYRDMNSFK